MGSGSSVPKKFVAAHNHKKQWGKRDKNVPDQDPPFIPENVVYQIIHDKDSEIAGYIDQIIERGLKSKLEDMHDDLSRFSEVCKTGKFMKTKWRAVIRRNLIEILNENACGSEINDIVAQIKGQLTVQESEARDRHRSLLMEFVSQKPYYPMYVMSVEELSSFSSLPVHESALLDGKLLEVVELVDKPGRFALYSVHAEGEQMKRGKIVDTVHRANLITISHQWLRPSHDPAVAHPDSEDAVKLKRLKNYFSQDAESETNFVWMDYFSIPQAPGTEQQLAAIRSLPVYFLYSAKTFILSASPDHLLDRQKGYLSRGHCLLELVTTKLPRIDLLSKWFIPGTISLQDKLWGHTQAIYFASDDDAREFSWSDIYYSGSPFDGNFTHPGDAQVIAPIISMYASVFRAFHSLYLEKLLKFETWGDAELAIDPDEMPQVIEKDLCPRDWVQTIFPLNYADVLEKHEIRDVQDTLTT